MGKELVSKRRKLLHILARLSAPEYFVEFCRRESFKNYIIYFMFVKNQTKILFSLFGNNLKDSRCHSEIILKIRGVILK